MTAAEPTRVADEPAERIAAAVETVPAVAAMHAGRLGEIGTYLPGRRVAGVRVDGDRVAIHVTVWADADIGAAAAAVRRAVSAATAATVVDVTIEDLADRNAGGGRG